MIDEKLSDGDICRLWVEHFPKRNQDVKSKTLCLAVCMIVEQRAAADASPDEDLLHTVHDALAVLGIPREEFYQAQLEWPEKD